MVFLLGRMGNNKQALTLIIERLGDVHRVINSILKFMSTKCLLFLLGYWVCQGAGWRWPLGGSPKIFGNPARSVVQVVVCWILLTHLSAFIRGLLENVGVEISPIRLIRRIKNGLEIPGLKEALIKILQDFHLQISLLEGCQTIMNGDSSDLSRTLQKNQTSGFFLTGGLWILILRVKT